MTTAIRTLKDKNSPKKKKKPVQFQSEVFVSLFQLFPFSIKEMEELILGIFSSEAVQSWLTILNCILEKTALLRLSETTSKDRINVGVFQKLLQFVTEQNPVEIQKGLCDILSVCPELLKDVESMKQLLITGLNSTNNGTKLCALLINESKQLAVAFRDWSMNNSDYFCTLNWKIALLPTYLANNQPGDEFLSMLEANLLPVLSNALTINTGVEELQQLVPNLDEVFQVVVDKCLSKDKCIELMNELAEFKFRPGYYHFRHIGRKSLEFKIYIHIILRSSVELLKKSKETYVAGAYKTLSNELNWILNHSKIDKQTSSHIVTVDPWNKFVKYTLRTGLRAENKTQLPILALELLYSMWKILEKCPSDEVSSAAQQVHDMILSHSDFMTVILDEEGFWREQKRTLLEVLIILIKVRPKLCQNSHIPLLLASYQASMSITDQLILKLLYLYEMNGVTLSNFRPYLWGAAAAAEYSVHRGVSQQINSKIDAAEVLTLLDSEKMLKTAYSFPLEIALNKVEVLAASDTYDPRFLLPLLTHISSLEYTLHSAKFVQSGAVSLLFAALSSSNTEVRCIAWLAIGRFYEQIESKSVWNERCLWQNLIDCLRRGAASQCNKHGDRYVPAKLSNILTLFLAKSAAILRNPGHPLYGTINNFFLIKPVLDVNNVPEFLVLLHGTDLPAQRIQERTFLLDILRNGLRTHMDYVVCARRRVFRLLLTIQSSQSLVDQQTKSEILCIVESSIRHNAIAHDMVENRSLITWLSGLLLSAGISEARQILQIADTLWDTLYTDMMQTRANKDKKTIDNVLELEKQLNEIGKEESTASKKHQKKNMKASKVLKPIWSSLPSHQRIIPPWIQLEFFQLLQSLWHTFSHLEIDGGTLNIFTHLIYSASLHLYESKQLIETMQKANTSCVHYIFPSHLLSISFMEQLIAAAKPFVSELPDLMEHLDMLQSRSPQEVNPGVATTKWDQLHSNMQQLQKTLQYYEYETLRHELHMLLSLAESGV